MGDKHKQQDEVLLCVACLPAAACLRPALCLLELGDQYVSEGCLLPCRKGRMRIYHVHKIDSYRWAQRTRGLADPVLCITIR